MFQNSLNGVNAFSRALDIIGHNLSNSENIGYKKQGIHFSEALSSAGQNSSTAGISAPEPMNEFKQGVVIETNNPLDIAIRGNGVFQVSQGRAVSPDKTFYTREGQFKLEIDSIESSGNAATQRSYITTGGGNYLMGWGPGVSSTQPTAPLVISHAQNPGKTTSDLKLNVNLDARSEPVTKPFDITDPTTYTWATTTKSFDSQGTPHDLTIYFARTDEYAWNTYTSLDRNPPIAGNAPQQIRFDRTGRIEPGTTIATAFNSPSPPATVSPISISLDNSTLFSDNSSANSLENDGYGNGWLKGISVAPDGTINGEYSNGFAAPLGRIALARFKSPEGLTTIGGNLWFPSNNSGPAELWPDTTVSSAANAAAKDQIAGWGALQSQSIEKSTTDTAADLINLVVMQRNYQANAKGIETQNSMIQSLLNI